MLLAAPGCSCGDDDDSLAGEGEGEGEGDGGWQDDDGGLIEVRDGGVVIETDGGTVVCYITICDGHELECGNCTDDDGDGRVDWMDPECLGPCDNTEGPALSAGIGGEAGGPCKADCYFDFGNGPGNDDCHWDHQCDPLAVAPDFPPEGEDCAYDAELVGSRDCPGVQSDQCLDNCRPLTPNGCDCFGCCTFPELEGSGGFVWIGHLDDDNQGTCTFEDILDAARCPPCTPVAGCFNDCGRCEVCLGRPEPPADCEDDGGGPDAGPGGPDGGSSGGDVRCEPGIQTCGLAGDDLCPADSYCITGCCQPILF
jgi:hypothetical protein